MKFFIYSILWSYLLSASSFSAPWGPGVTGYNPFSGRGFLTGGGPSSPPFYNPGPGNLAPLFSYTQPSLYPQNQPNFSSNLNTDAKRVIGKWTLRADELKENPGKITDTNEVINNDRNILENARRAPGLSQEDKNSIGQILILLNLAEIRMLTGQLDKAKEAFSDSYRMVTQEQKTTRSLIQKKEWYLLKRDRLDNLLASLKGFLNSYPQFKQTPPELLVGISTAIEEGEGALNVYRQLCNCLESPNLPYCKTLVRTSSTRRNTNFISSGFLPTYERDQEDNLDES